MAQTLTGNWNYPTSIKFGAGRIKELPAVLRAAGIAKPLLVTDPFLAGQEMVTRAVALCAAEGIKVAVFSDITSDPTGETIAKGAEQYRRGEHDGVIAFGGGSALDAGKAIAFVAKQTRPLFDFEDIGDYWTRADAAAIAPVVAVPTTSGTGSEVGRASVIKDEAAKVKRIIFHPLMLPRFVIADPELTVGMPAQLTAAVGMDALSHNLEAFFAPGYHPLARGIALEGIRLVKDWLPVVVREPKNIDARAHMLAASEAGATAFQRGLGAMHALAHPLGAVYGKHHGLLNAVLMPYVLAANAPVIRDEATLLARSLALGDKPEDFYGWVVALRKQVGIPSTLAELDIPATDIDLIAKMATEDPSGGTNPQPLTAANYAQILKDALSGNLPDWGKAGARNVA